MMKTCPFRLATEAIRQALCEQVYGGAIEPTSECIETDCACWEANTGTCGFVTRAYLQGLDAVLAETKDQRGR